MAVINKQKFLAELGKLLTFMYEEDRLAALEMYSAMYDEAESEEALSQFLMSPTRQAVIIARAYDAGARKLQGTSKAKDGSFDEAKYAAAIENLRAEAVSKGVIAEHFAEPEAEETVTEEAALAEEEQVSLPEESEEEPETETAPAEAVSSEPETEEAPAEAAETEAPEVIKSENQINAFMEQFHIEAENLGTEPAAEPAKAESEAPAEEPAPVETAKPVLIDEPTLFEEKPEPVRMVRKPKVFLLILYILVAIPITVAGFTLLLVPTVLLLALAAIFVGAGVSAMVAVFSGFAVLADILVVLGLALVVCSLALFLLWTFIWFTVDVLIGFVVSAFRLGGKWCYKEVPEV